MELPDNSIHENAFKVYNSLITYIERKKIESNFEGSVNALSFNILQQNNFLTTVESGFNVELGVDITPLIDYLIKLGKIILFLDDSNPYVFNLVFPELDFLSRVNSLSEN